MEEGPVFLQDIHGEHSELGHLSEDDIVIAIVGPTGAGKTTFVNICAGDDAPIGHGLAVCTTSITAVRFAIPCLTSSAIVLVDTPGLDILPGYEVSRNICDWLKKLYQRHINLSGILYFQQILDGDVGAFNNAIQKWLPFETLGTKDARHTKALVTTMWNKLDEKSAIKSETAMKTEWSSMVSDPFSTTFRFLGTRLSAVRILLPHIKTANGKKTSLILKEVEKVSQHLLVANTRALLYQDLHSLIARQRELLNTICIELEQVLPNETSLKPLIDEHQEVTTKLRSRLDLVKSLKLPLSKRMLDTLLVVVSWNWFKGLLRGGGPRPALQSQSYLEGVTNEDVIILLSGSPGSGKSQFVHDCLGCYSSINDDSTSDNKQITMVRGIHDGANVVLLKVPGFDSDVISNESVVKMFIQCLKAMEGRGLRLNRLLYLHGVLDQVPRNGFTLLKYLFEIYRLRVVLATTMWDTVDLKEGESMESVLKQSCWKEMIDGGALTKRLGGSDDARELLGTMIADLII